MGCGARVVSRAGARDSESSSSLKWLLLLLWQALAATRLCGIPADLRPALWPRLASSDDLLCKNKGVFEELNGKQSQWTTKIGRDLARTFSDHECFSGKRMQSGTRPLPPHTVCLSCPTRCDLVSTIAGRARLLAVLKCYSLINPSLGYCQGQSTQ
jgi:hypothetical protein